MHILVLDTIHGGVEIATSLTAMGHDVEAVDVYRGTTAPRWEFYDCIVAPVHLDPDHPYLTISHKTILTHHETVAWILEGKVPTPLVEITGARGKTTTAHALASLMPGVGILHTSRGTIRYPEGSLLWRRSITPASLIPAALTAREIGGWCIAEQSLGVSGAGDLAVLTSDGDYPIAATKRSALTVKRESLARAKLVITPRPQGLPREIPVDRVVSCHGTTCSCHWGGVEHTFNSSLLALSGYRDPLILAAAAACLLGKDPAPLAAFCPVEGRMAVRWEDATLVVDRANSGIDTAGTIDAARYAREVSGDPRVTLVIGEESSTVCEGYAVDQMEKAILAIEPSQVILVGDRAGALPQYREAPRVMTLSEGYRLAKEKTEGGSIVLAVKMWR